MKKILSILFVFLLSLFELPAQNNLLQYQFKGVDDEFANDFAKDIITDVIGKSQLQVNETMHYVLTYEQKTLALSYSASVSNVSGSVRQENADLYSDLEGVVRRAVVKSLEELRAVVRPEEVVKPVETEGTVDADYLGTSRSEQSGVVQTETSIYPKMMSFNEFKQRIRREKGNFFDKGSLAYKKYKSYNTMKVCGWTLLSAGVAMAIPVGVPVLLCSYYSYYVSYPVYDYYGYYLYDNGHWEYYDDYGPGIACICVGGGLMIAGAVLLGCMKSQLQQSYQYYVQGEKRYVSLDWHPSVGVDYAGVGVTVRF